MAENKTKLKLKCLGIDTQHEHFVYMRHDCHICISEGFESLTRVQVSHGNKKIVASLNFIGSDILRPGEVSLSKSAISDLGAKEGDFLGVTHLKPIESLSYVRSKIYGNRIKQKEFDFIVKDIVAGNYSNIHLSAFISACAALGMCTEEIIALTKSMIGSGETIKWQAKTIVDKHCIGGLPGNRTTPIIVAIVAAAGLIMPKTSSRAITSPAGTADTMEVMTPVMLTTAQVRKVVKAANGCVVWGGKAGLSPADDILIKVEKALEIDSAGQLIASVLSKKVAAGSTHVVIDMPVGGTAKLRSIDEANVLKIEMEQVAHAIGLKIKVVISDGRQPIGRGIGPALEARDVLAVLRNEKNAPQDLRERALLLSGEIIELAGQGNSLGGHHVAQEILSSGAAYKKFIDICEAQGGFSEPQFAKYQYKIKAPRDGRVTFIDNRKLARVARLAGAPEDKAAGVEFLAPLDKQVKKGDVLYVIHADSKGELAYSLSYHNEQQDVVVVK